MSEPVYRLLNIGEMIQDGDEWWIHETKTWNPVKASQFAKLEAHLPCRRRMDVPEPAQQKRISVRLFAPIRVLNEGGDWPVRVSRDGVEDVGTWIEIKQDQDGWYVEDHANTH
jgi:hypothetical protein